MEALNVELVNPKAKSLLLDMVSLNLINIKSEPTLPEMLSKLRRNEVFAPSSDEIQKEVELVRKMRYARKTQNHY
ncbi:MAG: hypothetical protein LBV31_04140 [Prevotellaceae bacterium]|jgi:hypothetical protein|nr:hypothetical protein [Prevotellaceae bacterium]